MLKMLVIMLILFKMNTSGLMIITDIIIRLIYSEQMPYFSSYHQSK